MCALPSCLRLLAPPHLGHDYLRCRLLLELLSGEAPWTSGDEVTVYDLLARQTNDGSVAHPLEHRLLAATAARDLQPQQSSA